MKNILLNKIYLVFFLFIPLSIVIGPSISLINITIICLLFIFYYFFIKKINKIRTFEITLLFILYLYLIFNSFISIDFQAGVFRNFGFLRFIIFFIAINYIFNSSKNNQLIFNFWSIVIFIVIIDSFVETIFGKNILGYGDDIYKNRIVSFFKDEPIVGAYILGFAFICIGYYFDKLFNKNVTSKILLLLIIFSIISCIVLTGERANGIKAILGLLLFTFMSRNLDFKIKFSLTAITIFILYFIISNSWYLKVRYGQQLFSQLFDKNLRSSFLENSLYLKLYKSGYAVFIDYPIFGVGNKNYRVITTQNLETKQNADYMLATHPHQIYFELLAEHGLIGSIIILSIFFTLIFKNLKVIILSRNSIQLGCFIYLILQFLPLLPTGSFFNDFNSTLFWINLSILYASNTKTNIFSKN